MKTIFLMIVAVGFLVYTAESYEGETKEEENDEENDEVLVKAEDENMSMLDELEDTLIELAADVMVKKGLRVRGARASGRTRYRRMRVSPGGNVRGGAVGVHTRGRNLGARVRGGFKK